MTLSGGNSKADKARILVVDDQQSIRKITQKLLELEEYVVAEADGGERAVELLAEREYDLVITDLRMNGMSGLGLAAHCRDKCPATPVLLVTAYASAEVAKEALKLGVFDLACKPVKVDELLDLVARALEYRRQKLGVSVAVSSEGGGDVFVAESKAMRDLVEMVKRVSPTSTPVLLWGEAHTGKRTVAKRIHLAGRTPSGPFESVDCAALSLERDQASALFGAGHGEGPGALARASGGTLFIGNIHALLPGVQKHLLTVLREGSYVAAGEDHSRKLDCRLTLGAERRLTDHVQQGGFDPELAVRLCLIPLHVPALRDRKEDLVPLAKCIVGRLAAAAGRSVALHPDLCDRLSAYSWPGNIRELTGVLSDAMAKGGEILTPDLLPAQLGVSAGGRAPGGAEKQELMRSYLGEKPAVAGEGRPADSGEAQKEPVVQKIDAPPVHIPAACIAYRGSGA